MPSNRKAFTIIELLIVVGVIAILAAIVLMGMRSITGRSKEQQTRLMLKNLHNMLAEFEVNTRLNKGPAMWGWYDGTTRINESASGTTNFWRNPTSSTDLVDRPLDAPGNVTSPDGNPADATSIVRNGARQLLNTQLAMSYILSVPANRSALQGIQSDRYFTPQWVGGMLRAPGGDRVLQTNDDAPTGEPVYYLLGSRVMHKDPNTKQTKVWRCVLEHVASAAPPGAQWIEEGTEAAGPKSIATVLLMDAWNNPILFVPATGLLVRKLNGESKLDPAKPGQTFVIVSPEGNVRLPDLAGNIPGTLEANSRGKPFFASAGPDGDFSTGDDNLYSFEE